MNSHYKDNCTLVKKCMEVCCENLRDPAVIPADGAFRKYLIRFDFRGSKNAAFFSIEHQSENIRWLRFLAVRSGHDMAVSNYIKKGTNEELIAYLSDESNIPTFVSDLQNLSDSLDSKLD